MTLMVMMTMVMMIMTILALQLSQEEERGRMEITRMGKVGDDKKNYRDNWMAAGYWFNSKLTFLSDEN